MQERHIAGEAGQSASSWYLSRRNKPYGPLGDRELLLLAERGGLKKDDLLWKPGFDKWQPVRSVCDLEAKPTVAAAKPAAVQGADEVTTTTRISETHLDETPASEAEPA